MLNKFLSFYLIVLQRSFEAFLITMLLFVVFSLILSIKCPSQTFDQLLNEKGKNRKYIVVYTYRFFQITFIIELTLLIIPIIIIFAIAFYKVRKKRRAKRKESQILSEQVNTLYSNHEHVFEEEEKQMAEQFAENNDQAPRMSTISETIRAMKSLIETVQEKIQKENTEKQQQKEKRRKEKALQSLKEHEVVQLQKEKESARETFWRLVKETTQRLDAMGHAKKMNYPKQLQDLIKELTDSKNTLKRPRKALRQLKHFLQQIPE